MARAVEVYAKQAKNVEAERKATEIRLRAERRTGELLRELERATPQTANPSGVKKQPASNGGTRVVSEYAATLDRSGLSHSASIAHAREASQFLRPPKVSLRTGRIRQ